MNELTILSNGYPSIEEIMEYNGWPSAERFAKGPVAIVECVQDIPCNPCEAACKFGAIQIGNPITNTPKINGDKCTGCMSCVAACPGLAIFIIDKSYSDKMASITFPFEYRPLPNKGDIVKAVNRVGEYLCEAEVLRVATPKNFNRTTIITIEVPQEFIDDARGICRLNAETAPAVAEKAINFGRDLPDDVLVCRCEEVTVGEIKKAIQEYGADSVTSVKRHTRAGMGLCQGKTCTLLVTRILMQELGKKPQELPPGTFRAPVRPTTFGELGGINDDK